MRFTHRNAAIEDLPRIVEIYNLAVATRESSCDLEPTTVAAREHWFVKHTGSRRPPIVTRMTKQIPKGWHSVTPRLVVDDIARQV